MPAAGSVITIRLRLRSKLQNFPFGLGYNKPCLSQRRTTVTHLHPNIVNIIRGMKRVSKPKIREKLPDYCDVEPRRDDTGAAIWPAQSSAIEAARDFIKEWY